MTRTARRGTRVATVLLLFGGLLGTVPAGAQQPSDTLDQPISLGNEPEDLGDSDRFPLQISGFGVGEYTYDGRTGDNSFAAGKVAVALFREITDILYVFGQLTTSISDEGGGEPGTEIEIDNLLLSVSFTPPGASNVNLTFGTLDAPGRVRAGRRGAQLLTAVDLASTSSWPARPKSPDCWDAGDSSRNVGLEAFVANGWDSPLDPNHGKTVAPGWPFSRRSATSSRPERAVRRRRRPGRATNDRSCSMWTMRCEPGLAGSWRARRTWEGPRPARWQRRDAGPADAAGPPPVRPALGDRRAGGGVRRQDGARTGVSADARLLDDRADLLARRGTGRDLRQHPAHYLPDPPVPASR